ncbi:unnamed protein product [Symbiodinium sp. KB8]|nr:unnamed protein product [Symbiodinium sp. KB8]
MEDSESLETTQGQDLCPWVAFSFQAFVANLVLLADMIAVRSVVHIPMPEGLFFAKHGAFEVADLILLRHRRSVDAIMSLNMARFLNEVARDIMSQDLDETYMLVRLQGNPYPPARQPAITLQEEDCFVTRPIGPPTVTDGYAWLCGMQIGFDLTHSSKSLPAAEPMDPAKDFLLTAAKRSLDQAFEGADAGDKDNKAKSAKKDDKKGKKEKKDGKAEREKKKKGSSSEKESDSESCGSQSSQGFFSEVQAMFCLRQKDLQRQNGQDRLDDLSTRQIAFVVSGAGAGRCLAAADFQEIGGDLGPRLQKPIPRQATRDPGVDVLLQCFCLFASRTNAWAIVCRLEAVHSDRAQHAKKTKQKQEENQATAQAALASTLWRKRLAALVQTCTGRGLGSVTIVQCVTLVDVAKKKKWKRQDLENTLEAEVEKYRKDATKDLQSSLKSSKKPGSTAKEEPKRRAPKAAVKQEEESDGAGPNDDDKSEKEGDDDAEKFREDGWPEASGDEDDDDDDGPKTGKPGHDEEKDDPGEESSDSDLFRGPFGRSNRGKPQSSGQQNQKEETLFQKLNPQLQKQAQSIDKQDYSLMVQILLKEEVFTMESLRDCLDLDGGGFIGNLGESKSLYSRLSALAKKAAKIWQSKLLESQATPVRTTRASAENRYVLPRIGRPDTPEPEANRTNARGEMVHSQAAGDRPVVDQNLDGYTVLWRVEEVACGLQVRGCKPELQKSAMAALEVITGVSLPADYSLDLLPGNDECSLEIKEHQVDLASLKTFLDYTGLAARWERSQLLTPAQRSLHTGIRMSTVAWFIFRAPFQETFQDEIRYARLHKRLIHRLAQLAEQHMSNVLQASLPTPQSGDVLHPAKRDGRRARGEPKLQNVLAIERFMTRGDGKAVAQELGLSVRTARSLCKTEYQLVKRPRILSGLHQEKLTAREHIRAVANVLNHLGVSLDDIFPKKPLKPLSPSSEILMNYTLGEKTMPFITSVEDGDSRWDVPDAGSHHIRLIVCPDEGSPMFSSYVFLATRNASINLCRDELLLSFKGIRSRAHKLNQYCLRVLASSPLMKRFSGESRATRDDVLQQLFGHHILIENNITPECDDQVNFDRVSEILGKLCRLQGAIEVRFEVCS